MPFPVFRKLGFVVGSIEVNSRFLTGPSARFGMTTASWWGVALIAALKRCATQKACCGAAEAAPFQIFCRYVSGHSLALRAGSKVELVPFPVFAGGIRFGCKRSQQRVPRRAFGPVRNDKELIGECVVGPSFGVARFACDSASSG